MSFSKVFGCVSIEWHHVAKDWAWHRNIAVIWLWHLRIAYRKESH